MIDINIELVKSLIKEQFPKWANLPIYPVEKSGHDNRTFHLGNKMTIRLPSGEGYAAQVEKEAKWLPKLKPYISLPITRPIAMGKATKEYPFPWSINEYLEGETVTHEKICNEKRFAIDLANFLLELEAVDIHDGPRAGLHNYYRGGDLSVYHNQTEQALLELENKLPTQKLRPLWQKALSTKWEKKNVWIHGDVETGNLLIQDGILCGIIDFGVMGMGDPACDFAMAWTFFDPTNRNVFFEHLHCDQGTIDRARGWALWKALITYEDENVDFAKRAKSTIHAILNEVG